MDPGAAPAVVEPIQFSFAFEGPLVTFAKWAITAFLWAEAFNIPIVLATYGFSGAGDHWSEFLLFPFNVIYRHIARGVNAAIGSIMPKKCSTVQRMLLGGSYCDRVEAAAKRIEELQRNNVGKNVNRC